MVDSEQYWNSALEMLISSMNTLRKMLTAEPSFVDIGLPSDKMKEMVIDGFVGAAAEHDKTEVAILLGQAIWLIIDLRSELDKLMNQ